MKELTAIEAPHLSLTAALNYRALSDDLRVVVVQDRNSGREIEEMPLEKGMANIVELFSHYVPFAESTRHGERSGPSGRRHEKPMNAHRRP